MTTRDRQPNGATRDTAAKREEVRVGISACLLGEAVRYDGGHKYEAFVVELAELFTLVPVCPEVEIGLGVPRETLHLKARANEIRMIAASGADHTDTMRDYAQKRVAELARLGLSGYVFKSNSPSCGIRGVAVEGTDRAGQGLFAAQLMCELAALPVEEEVALRNPSGRRGFIERVLAYHRRHRDH